MPLGRVLVMLRLASDADLRAVLHVQQAMKFEGLPGQSAVRALSFMRENKVHIEWALKQIGWESAKFRKEIPAPLRELKEKIADVESRLGTDHPEVAELMLKLMDFYADEKMWAHAEATGELALQKLQKANGEIDLKVANACLKMSDLLFHQDRFDEASPYIQRCFQIRQQILGPSDPLTASALRSLAETYDMQKNYADAERCYVQALAIVEQTHDVEDEEVLYILRQLGSVCRRSSRTPDMVLVGTLLTESGMVEPEQVPQALAFSKEKGVPLARALVMMELLSEDALRPVLHAQFLIRSNLLPAVIAVRALRICHRRAAPLEEALEVIGWRLTEGKSYQFTNLLKTHDQLLEAERTLPPEAPELGALCLRLADLFENYERYADSEPLFKRALIIMSKNSGRDESITEILDRLAWVHVKQQKYALAEQIYRKSLEMRTAMFGEESQEVAGSYYNLARLQTMRGRHDDAVIWLQKALPLVEQFHGEKSPQYADIVADLAVSFYELGAHKSAEPLFWQAYKLKSVYLERTSFEIVSLLRKLAEMYTKDGMYTMADSVLVLFNEDKQVTI